MEKITLQNGKLMNLTLFGSNKLTYVSSRQPSGMQQMRCHADSVSSITEPELALELAPKK